MSETEAAPKKKSKKAASQSSPGDPMLDDAESVVKERLEGKTSDAASRVEGTSYEDVDPDPSTAPDKASDAEDYAFPPGGDVDVLTIDPGSGDGEFFTPPTIEDWVVLDGAADEVPDALDGTRAAVLGYSLPEGVEEPIPWEDRDQVILNVKTRDQYNATLFVPFSAVKRVEVRGITPVAVK